MATADEYADWIVKNADKRGTPAFDTVAKAYQEAKTQPDRPTSDQKLRSSGLMRFVQGLRDPIDAGAQLLPFIAGGVASAGGIFPNKVSDYLFSEFDKVNAGVKDANQKLEQARTATGQEGVDLMRLGGNVVSPANVVMSGAVGPTANAVKSTIPRLMGSGAVQGAAGGITSPVESAEGGADFAMKKGLQVATGAVTGAVAGPVIGKVVEALAPRVSALLARVEPGQRAPEIVEQALAQALKEAGQSIDDIPKQHRAELTRQVAEALRGGRVPDVAASARKLDFEALGIKPTTGQITRDPTQFALERNLRASPDVGTPLLERFASQNKTMGDVIGGFGGRQAQEVTPASNMIADALGRIDERFKGVVNTAYSQARDSIGRAAPMDAPAFSKAANLSLDEGMLGHYLPTEIRGILNDVTTGKIPFNVQTSVQIDQVLSAAQRSAGQNTPQALAIGKVRDALNKTPIENGLGEMTKAAFDAARGLAKKRFDLHEAIPALEAAATGKVSPDDFVNRFVVNGKPTDVKNLAKLLEKSSPEAFQEARNQIGSVLQRAAFGENAAGDKLARPESLAKAIRNIGTEKLSAFYTPAEIEKLKAASRVTAYMNATPSASPVLGNPNFAWAGNLLSQAPGGKAVSTLANALAGATRGVRQAGQVNNALAANVPQSAPDMSPEMLRTLVNARRLATLGAGGAAASSLGQ